MITGEIKNRIDSIWDTFWTGGITNSITILEQMTYLFFMKMLDDAQRTKEANANVMGVAVKDPTFKEGNWLNPETDKEVPYNSLRWNTFKNMEAEQMYRTISKDAFIFIKNLNEGRESAYGKFMSNATFLIQSPRTLVKIVEGIDHLDMNNRDTMGDVYEYVLGKMAASGNNGQFRTPRHIIRMMVELMEPSLKDTICDPAMGSAGFIVESAKYIQTHYKSELLKKENAAHYKNGMLHGFDTDATMLRIGAMNLMLHGVDNPDIQYQDSLSTDNTDADRYTLCLANPPFTGSLDNEAVSKSLLAITKTKKTELLFLALFVRMLQIGGRCASIVPDGVLFGNSTGHKSIRKELIDRQRLQAVISMPSGVFRPYAGVSTAILIFTKTNAGGTDKVWFYDMKADGFSLDDKRTPIADNDIPDVIARFHNLAAEESRTRKEQSFIVPVSEIIANDYDLSINKYKEVEKVKVEYEKPEVVLG
ncbi:MAG: SAM-dependent DNA methyltransferase, partial [Paludibacteraceae bacterium]|nr:SAM-dependent DNA methyltransferase [Paludibacteraceae bacterium]